ncbi:D-glycero-beta-D-manno-heptose-7-phosphate kinase [Azospirillum picis]|uniref:Bifunctional protein HldE n=1 Tax=Azospirillum picis TaxID=488438 RepID=A0ABU0MPK2_9PROT|nr:D-glycero-beta-D-manno-heptose-7-phosphate kinase [Azospirillum picis]MBP2301494.1 D-beta-D-heptose 7-phosphate kinase/D-beta-D-heptose 1-phosphate adenosyltransferase [Azospirillum picis]MDQ0535326.1 D-beta-D-heptose 7-phosphate kinase/D-beta-D-heptose 1-phosphate adenosyltransferase [Azospirillum picis]
MSDLARHIDTLSRANVLCLGDVMLDRFVYGSVERVSPEAPIPVLRIERELPKLGGAGNVAANLVALDAACRFVSVVGGDAVGGDLLGLLRREGVGSDAIVVEDDRQTTVKTRFIAGQQQLLRTDVETVVPITVGDRVLERVRAALPEVGGVILSDYGKGVLTDELVVAVIAAARAAGRTVVVDPKGRDYRRYRGADIVTPNRKELMEATGLPVRTDAEVVAAARQLIEGCGIGAVVATRSEQGMSVVTATNAVHLPAEAREVFDVSGAGDTVVATLAAALSVGIELVDAARLANLAAGIVVGKVGTAVVRSAELLSSLHELQWRHGEEKVVTRDAAAERAERWRLRGKRVGFTNGCFDLLHPGHISLLKQARAACDVLVVGLNSDASVKRLKGESRPVQNETARATVLASLGCVDLVVVFGEDTPEELIRALRPEVLVKGADYTVATVVGADFVQSYGGEVVLAELVQGQSTTNTIKRMKG